MLKKHIEVLSHDEEYNTIFARGVSGSVTLDIIPDAISYLKGCPTFEKMYLQDFMGIEFIIDQQATIESAIDSWQRARDIKMGVYPFPSKKSTVAPIEVQEKQRFFG